jgi:hypothetical protein
MSPSKAPKRDTSSEPTKRNTTSAAKAQDPSPPPPSPDPNTTINPASQSCTSKTCSAHHHHHHHHYDHDHDQPSNADLDADGARRNSTDSDLTTWAHLSVDRSGAKVRKICTQDHEDVETCSRTGRERKYRDIPRVDGPSEKITVEGVRAMMERDAEAEREAEEGGWVVVGEE